MHEAFSLDITLTRQSGTQVQVTCDGQPSHSFDLQSLALAQKGQPGLPQPLDDPVAYGKAAYQALFPAGSPAQQALEAMPTVSCLSPPTIPSMLFPGNTPVARTASWSRS